MELGEALYRGLSGRSPRTEGTQAAMVAELRKAYSTSAPPGVSGRTWRRLRADPAAKRAPGTLRALRDAQRALRFRAARRRLAAGKELRVRGIVRVSSDERERTIRVGPWIDGAPDSARVDGQPMPSTHDVTLGVIERLEAGRPGEAAAYLNRALNAAVGQRLTFADTSWIKQVQRGSRD